MKKELILSVDSNNEDKVTPYTLQSHSVFPYQYSSNKKLFHTTGTKVFMHSPSQEPISV